MEFSASPLLDAHCKSRCCSPSAFAPASTSRQQASIRRRGMCPAAAAQPGAAALDRAQPRALALDASRCTRRDLSLATLAALAAQLLRPQAAAAAGLPRSIWNALTLSNDPEPVLFPRKALSQIFAVLLMRSAYDAVDELDFVPMDRFQAQFWKLRQAEYEPYLLQRSPLKTRQGDLTDASYFDYISFAQLATITQEMTQARQEFEEFCEDCEGQRRRVSRAPALADNGALPAAFEARTGDLIYDGLLHGFRGLEFGAPPPAPRHTPIQELARNAQRLLNIFVANGYALKATVSSVVPARSCAATEWHGACPSAGTFTVKLEGPATLWGTAALEHRRALCNAYDAMALGAFLRRSGCSARYSLEHSDTAIQEFWTVA